MKTSRRILAMVLVLAMLISNVPVQAFATETEPLPSETAEETVALMETEPEQTEPETEPAPPETEPPTEPAEEEPVEQPTEETQAQPEETVSTEETMPEEPAEEPTEETVGETVEETVTEPQETVPEETVEETVAEPTEETVPETTESLLTEEEAAVEEEEALSETYAPYLGYRFLSLNENGEWYENTDATMNTYMTIQPTEFYYQGRNRYNEYQIIFYLNTYDGESWTQTPVSLSDLSWTKSNMVMYQQTSDVTGSNKAYYSRLIANTDAWDASGFISYALDSDVAGISYQTTYTEGAFYLGSPYDDTNLIAHYECDTAKSEDVLYFYFQSEDWELVSAELDSVNGADFATMAATGNAGEYTVTLNRNQVNVADNMDGMLLQVNCEMKNLHDDTVEVRPVRVICYAEEEVARDPIYLSYYYLDNSDSTGKWYLDPSAPERTLLVALPLDPVWVIFYLNVWNEDTQEYDMTPLTINQISYATNYMSMEYIPADQCEDALEQYFIQITPNTDTCWGTTSYFYHTVDANTTVSLSCYLGRIEHGLYIIDSYNGDTSVFNDATVVKRDRIDMNEGADNSFYFFFEPNHPTWTFKSVALNPVEGANLATMECVDADNNVYKITPTDETVQNAEALGNFKIVLDVEKYQNATGWIWTDNDTLWYNPPILPGEPEDPDQPTDPEPAEHTPFLSYGDLGNEGDGWYATNDEWGEMDGAPVLGYLGWNMTPYDECKHIFYLNTWNTETQGWDSKPVHVEFGEYLTGENMADHPDRYEIRDGEENAAYFVNITTDVWDKTSQVSYTMDDGTVVTMEMTIHLPETGFYSGPEMTNENYLPNNGYIRDPYNEEHVYYLGLYSDNWTLTGVEKQENGSEDLFTVSEVSGQPNMRKITLDPEYATTNVGIDPALLITAVDSIGYTNEWDWIAPSWTYCDMYRDGTEIEINGNTYQYFQDHDLPLVIINEGYSDRWGHDIERATVGALPAGAAYDPDSNVLTLSNAELTSVGMYYLKDDGSRNLATDELTIRVIGTNRIVSTTQNAMHFWNGLNVTVTSDSAGTLYLKSTNSESNVDDNGVPFSFDTLHMGSGTLTVQGNVTLIAEIAGTALSPIWENDQLVGTENAFLAAIRSDQSALTVKDNAKLETRIPSGAKGNGTKEQNWAGGYRGLEQFLHVNIQGGTVTTQSVHIPNRYDENGVSAYGSYTQTGGTVTLTAQGDNGEQEKFEWDEEKQEDVSYGIVDHYHYSGINAEHGVQVNISGGSLTINVQPTAEEGASSSWFHGISTYGGDVTISGNAQVVVNGTFEGDGVRVGYHGDMDGNLIRKGSFTMAGGSLYVESPDSYERAAFMESNTTLNITGGEISCGGGLRISDQLNVSGGVLNLGHNIELDHGAVMNVTGGELRFISDSGNPTVRAIGESQVNISGGTVNLQGRVWDFGGETNITGGTMNVDGGDLVLGYNTTVAGGKISVENANLVTRGMTNIWGGEITVTNGQFINEADGFAIGEPAQFNEDGSENEAYKLYAGRKPVLTINNDLTEEDPFRGFALLNEHGYMNVTYGGQIVINSINVLNSIVNEGMIHMTGGDIVINAESTPEWSEAYTEYDDNTNASFVPMARGIVNAGAFRMEADAGSTLTIDADSGIWSEFTADDSDGWNTYLDFCQGNAVSLNTNGLGIWANVPVTISGADVSIDAQVSDYFQAPAGLQIASQSLADGSMTPGEFNMLDGTLEITVPETESGYSSGLYMFGTVANFEGGTILATGDRPVIFVTPNNALPEINGSYVAEDTDTGDALHLEKFELFEDNPEYPDDYHWFVNADGETSHAVTLTGGSSDTEAYLSMRHLDEQGEGWFEDPDREVTTDMGITAMRESTVIFYWNTWNAESGQWDAVPVIPEIDSEYVTLSVLADAEEPYIREGEENGDYFVHMDAHGTLDHQELVIRYDGHRFPFHIHINDVAFYSAPERSVDTIIARGHYGLDAAADENAVYISVYDPEYMTIENLEVNVNTFGEDYNAMLTSGKLYTVQTITEGKLYKITIDPEYVQLVRCCWKNFNLMFQCDIVNGDGDRYEAGGDIWVNPPEEMAAEARFWFNSQEYIFYEGTDIVGQYEFGGYDENGGEIYNWKRINVPEGVRYDYDSNTLYLNNVSLADMSAVYRFDNGEQVLPGDELTIHVTGKNTIVSDDNYALNFWGGLNVTILGDGELYAKTTNHNNVNSDGIAYAVDTVTLHEANLTIAGDVTVIAEIAGEGSHTQWDDEGNAIGTEKARLTALHGQSWNSLTIQDNAVLTTILPEGARNSGTAEDNYAGGYQGIAGMGSILVQDEATVNTQYISMPCYFDDVNPPTGSVFTQTGGTVNIEATAHYDMFPEFDEDGEQIGEKETLNYYGLFVDAGDINITGGTMNITMQASPEELAQGAEGSAIGVGGGTLTIQNAQLNVDYNLGKGIFLGHWDVEAEDGGPVRGSLYAENAQLNLNAAAAGERIISSIQATEVCEVTILGGTVTTHNSRMYLNGPTSLGMEAQTYTTRSTVDGPVVTIENGEFNINNESQIINTTMNLTNSDFWFDGGMMTLKGNTITITDGKLEVWAAGTDVLDTNLTINNQNSDSLEFVMHISPYSYFNVGEGTLINIDATNWMQGILNEGTFHLNGGEVDVLMESTPDWSDFIGDDGEQWRYATDGLVSCGDTILYDGVLTVDAEAPLSHIGTMGQEDFPADGIHRTTLEIYEGAEVNLHSHGFGGLTLAGKARMLGGKLTIQSENGAWGEDEAIILTSVRQSYTYEDANGKILTVPDHLYAADFVIDGGNINILCQDTGDYNGADGIAKGILIKDGSLTINGGEVYIEAEEAIDDYVGEADAQGNIPASRISGKYLAVSNNNHKVLNPVLVYVPEGGAGLPGYHYHFEEDNKAGSVETGFDSATRLYVYGNTNKCGDDVYWKVEDGVLTIYGEGATYDFSIRDDYATGEHFSNAPWADHAEEITSITVEEGVTYVGNMAFIYLDNLTTINYPATLTGLGGGVVLGEKFTTYNIASGNKVYRDDNDGIVDLRTMTLVTVASGKSGTYTVSSDVKAIGNGAFEGTAKLNVVLNNGLQKIGDGAFAACGTETLVIPETVTTIGWYSFNNCTNLTEITIPASVTTMGTLDEAFSDENVFLNCPDLLVKVYCVSHARTYVETKNAQGTTIRYELIHSYDGGTCTLCGETVQKCGDNAFWKLEDGVLTIYGEGATYDFEIQDDSGARRSNAPWADYAEEITSVVVEEGITCIGRMVFFGMDNITAVSYPATLTDIGSVPFGEDFTSYSIASGNTVYRDDNDGIVDLRTMTLVTVASGKSGTYTVSSGIKAIGNGAFEGTANLNVVLNKGLEQIGDGAFAASGTETLIIPETVTTIGWYAFNSCTNLREITIPASVTTMGTLDEEFSDENVFAGCSDLLVKVFCTSNARTYVETKIQQGHEINYELIHTLDKNNACNYCDYMHPTTLKASNVAETGKNQLSWTAVEGAAKYQVWRSTSKNGTYTRAVTTTKTTWTHTAAVPGTTYYYYVVAVAEADSSKLSAKSNVVSRTCDLAQPVIDAINVASSGKIKITWDEVDDAVEYKVYRATSENGTYSLLKTTTSTSYTNTSAVAGKTYYYKVMAIAEKTAANSAYSEIASAVCKLERPTVTLSNVASSGKIKATWEEVEDAVGYAVYRSETKSGEYTLLDTVEALTYTDSTAEAGTTYYYRVKVLAENEKADSALSTAVSRTCDLARPVITLSNVASSGKIKVTWEAVEGAVEYKVYRATSSGGTYKLMKTTEATSYTNTSAEAGTTYYYKVMAIAENTAANSAYSSVKSRTCDLARPVLTVTNVASSGKIKLSWKAIDGAEEYQIQRSTDGETWSTLKNTTSTSYTNTSAQAGTTYYYRVRAIAEKSAANSVYSVVKSLTCKLARTTVTLTSVASTGKIKVSWTAVTGAQGYAVYRSEDSDGDYELLTETTSTSYTDKSAVAEEKYYYKVVVLAENEAANSAASSVKNRTCDLARPVVEISDNGKGKPRLTWDKVDGAVEYKVYRATSKSGTYSLVKTTTSTSYANTGATSGKTYYYKVMAVADNTAANSAYSSVVSFKVK